MRKILHALFTLLLVFVFFESKGQITIGAVDAGPYGYGSNITVPINFPGNQSGFPSDNTFDLQISDASGVFSANPVSLGTFSGFYTTGLNGLIPSTLPAGTGYKLRIVSRNPDNIPVSTITDVPGNITIAAVPSNAVTLTQTNISTSITGDNLGYCPAEAGDNKQPILRSNSTGITTTEIVVTNMATGASTTYTEVAGGIQTSPLATGTYAVKVTSSTLVGIQIIKSSRSYTLHNSTIVVNIQDIGQSRGCLDGLGGNAGISFGITVPSGVGNNDPQVVYRVDWGDGSTSNLTLADIVNNASRITHAYTITSCGQPPIQGGTGTITNSFKATISAISPLCGDAASTTGYAQIFINPVASITPSSTTGCLGIAMVFNNTSRGGTRFDCSTRMDYTWYVDGVAVPLNQQPTDTNPLVWTFTTAGPHTVRLDASNGVGTCTPSSVTLAICVQNPPQVSFTLPTNTLCLSAGTITPVNTSQLDNSCPNAPAPIYTWATNPATGVSYSSNGNSASAAPAITFSQIGIYNLSLTIQSAICQATTPNQEIVVNGTPLINMSPDARLCSQGGEFSFGPNGGVTQTTTTGTAKPLADTYTWTVTGGTTYTFDPTTPPNSQYPKITFTDYGTYTITLLHKNNCNPTGVTTSQTLTFLPSPSPIVTVAPTVCYGANINLSATINNTNPATTYSWRSSGSGTFSDPASLTPVYTPSAADLNALSTTITLVVNTGIPGECELVSAIKTIRILPNNTGTNTTQTICTTNGISYTPTSSVTGSTFRWTAANADGNAQTGSYPASGTGNITANAIVNTNPTATAEIIYTIIPESNGCDGVPFTFTVRVNPRPVLTASQGASPICSGNQLGITLTSNIPGNTTSSTRYTWTSTVSGVTDGAVTGNDAQPTPLATTVINNRVSNTGTTQATVTYTIIPYYVTADNPDGCPGTPVTVSVQIDPALTVADAGTSESICDQQTYTLKGNPVRVGNGLWTFVPSAGQSGVVITNPTSENAVVSGLTSGQDYTFRWTISGTGACGPTSSDVVITVNIPTVPGTTATADPNPVCEGTNSGTITLSGQTGIVLRWENSIDNGATWQAITNTTATQTYTNLLVSTQYRAVVQNGQCAAANSTATTINVSPATTIANAGADQTLCNQPTVQLSALSALKAGESGLWTVSPTLPNTVIVNPTNPTTEVQNLAAGTIYTFTWTITGPSPCGPTRDDVIVNDLLPITNTITSTSTEVCYNQTITITGNTPTGGNGTYTYQWEASTDGTTWTPLTGQTGKDLSYQLQATLSFRRIVTSSSCTSSGNVIRIIAQPPIANNTIAADQTICTGVVPVALTGTLPAGSDGNFNYQWQSSLNGTTWTDISGAVFIGYTPPILTATTLYRRIVSTITCNGDLRNTSNTVTITVKPNAKAEFTFTLDRSCSPFVIDANNVKAVAYPDRNATYTWYADNVQIGTGITFPGYTITTSNATVNIKLVTAPSTGCQPDEMSHDFSTSQAVAPAFTQSTASGCGPLVVNFVNTSTSLEGVTFRWDFGNGVTSSQTMPAAVTYQPEPTGKDTTYTVTLTATTTCGVSSVTSTVLVKAKPISIFSPSKTVGCAPLTVTFSNSSPGATNTFYYDFGDGTLLTKTDKLPVTHTFTTNVVRDFVVKMVAENECGRDESSYTIRVSPNTVLPELVVNANEQTGCAPLAVNFYNNSRGANVFKYDFGDGSTVITRSAPEVVRHTFTAAGTYTITLTASNGCSDTTTTESVTVLPAPVTGFTADITLGCPGLAVQFTNTSADGVSYLWDFGDGTTSNEFQPKHVFAGTQEYYTVSLTATNSLGCTATTTMNQYIHVVQPPIALFNVAPSTLISIPDYTFRFEDESTNNPTIWAWDFGDGTNSTLQNPSHTYPDTGRYVVTLRVSNQQGCFTTTFKTVTIVGVPGYLYVPNSFMPGSQTPELRTFIAKGSGIKSWRMSVFNKWGQTLWETTQLNEGRPVEGWDGTFNGILQPQGVFFWKIDVEFVNGTAWKGMTYDSSAPKKTGVIHLIR